MTVADRIIETLAARGQTVCVAESLTGGLLAAAFVDVPGASSAFAGGVVAYQTDQKIVQLDLDPALLADKGTVDPDVAIGMAEAVREKFGSDYSVSTTGVAGPDADQDKPAGTVYSAIASAIGTQVWAWHFEGDRREVREQTVFHALSGLAAILEEQS